MPVDLAETRADIATGGRWEFSSAVPIKFAVNRRIEYSARPRERIVPCRVQELAIGIFRRLNSFLIEKPVTFRNV
jgi:hypothetical protein